MDAFDAAAAKKPTSAEPEPAEIICDIDLMMAETRGFLATGAARPLTEKEKDDVTTFVQKKGQPYIRDGIRYNKNGMPSPVPFS